MKNENKIKHLEFIQLTITRMAYNSFLIKGWLMLWFVWVAWISTILDIELYILMVWVIWIIFWWLDAYYLCLERKFRDLYNQVRKKDETEIDFNMSIEEILFYDIFKVFKSFSLICFYMSLVSVSVIFIILN